MSGGHLLGRARLIFSDGYRTFFYLCNELIVFQQRQNKKVMIKNVATVLNHRFLDWPIDSNVIVEFGEWP